MKSIVAQVPKHALINFFRRELVTYCRGFAAHMSSSSSLSLFSHEYLFYYKPSTIFLR